MRGRQRRWCRWCGETLTRKRYPGGQVEKLPTFSKRRYCDKRCFGEQARARGAEKRAEREQDAAECTEAAMEATTVVEKKRATRGMSGADK
jgi:hypothetical protein